MRTAKALSLPVASLPVCGLPLRTRRRISYRLQRATACPLIEILGEEQFERLQVMWAQGGNRHRWSAAFPIIESYRVNDRPNAKAVRDVAKRRSAVVILGRRCRRAFPADTATTRHK
jgi:hypothetical protein